ncbi:MAG: hypothetical protein ACRBBT_06925 [Paracoccaceae bacterium]
MKYNLLKGALALVLAGWGAAIAAQEALQAEDQTPTGKFTTAAEVKPILEATRANWVALRDYNGQDLLYVTHLWAWRCGLKQMKVSLNGGAFEVWPLPPCHAQTAAPNAITEADGLPYRGFATGSIATVAVQVTYDDLSKGSGQWGRGEILMP